LDASTAADGDLVDTITEIDNNNNHNNSGGDYDNSSNGGGNGTSSNNRSATIPITSSNNNPSSSWKDTERQQIMYLFHGHTLVISTILKRSRSLLTGLSSAIITDIYDCGLMMIQHTIINNSNSSNSSGNNSSSNTYNTSNRSISCSIIRAGCIIISSCLSMGYNIARLRLPILLQSLLAIFTDDPNGMIIGNGGSSSSNSNGSSSSSTMDNGGSNNDNNAALTTGRTDSMIYEVMSIEAGLVVISSLLLFCPEALTISKQCCDVIITCIDYAFRALKDKYQSKLKHHFRLKTLHVMLLECFCWLPSSCYSSLSQQVFIEALRVFRDSVSNGYETTCLYNYVADSYSLLKYGGGQSAFINNATISSSSSSSTSSSSSSGSLLYTLEAPLSKDMMMLKLEQHSIALQKKETGIKLFLMINANTDFYKYNE